jgi:hypothetical protein
LERKERREKWKENLSFSLEKFEKKKGEGDGVFSTLAHKKM